ncbi:MAG: protease Do, partial [Rhodanobacter sp.]
MSHSILRTLAYCAWASIAAVTGAHAQTASTAAMLPDFTGIVEKNAPAVVHVEAKYTGKTRQSQSGMPGQGMPDDPQAEILRRFFG